MRPPNCFLRMLIFYIEHLSIAPVTPLDGIAMLRVLFKDPFLQIVMSSLRHSPFPSKKTYFSFNIGNKTILSAV